MITIGSKIIYRFSVVARPSYGEVIDLSETSVKIYFKRSNTTLTYTLPLSPQFEVIG